MSENGRPYSYGGSTDESVGWPDWVRDLAGRIAVHPVWLFPGASRAVPNVVLLNVYADGQDHVDWHADDEVEIDQRSPIASLSLGWVRRFQVRPARRPSTGVRRARTVLLEPGSLLVMPPGFQGDWHHRVPRESAAGVQRRWNLTFRVYGTSV